MEFVHISEFYINLFESFYKAHNGCILLFVEGRDILLITLLFIGYFIFMYAHYRDKRFSLFHNFSCEHMVDQLFNFADTLLPSLMELRNLVNTRTNLILQNNKCQVLNDIRI